MKGHPESAKEAPPQRKGSIHLKMSTNNKKLAKNRTPLPSAVLYFRPSPRKSQVNEDL